MPLEVADNQRSRSDDMAGGYIEPVFLVPFRRRRGQARGIVGENVIRFARMEYASLLETIFLSGM